MLPAMLKRNSKILSAMVFTETPIILISMGFAEARQQSALRMKITARQEIFFILPEIIFIVDKSY